MQQKLTTVAASGFTNKDLERALQQNHRLLRHSDYLKLSPNDFFHNIKLSERNSPKYIRENFQELTTNNICNNYQEYRFNERFI